MDIRLVTTSFNDEVHGTFNEKKTGCGINLLKSENVTRYHRSGIMRDLGEITCEKCKTKIAKEMIKSDQKEMKLLLKEEKLSEVQEVRMAMREREVSQMLDGYAAEEFGYGADTESMPLMARFFRRLYAADYRRHADPFRRIWLWFFKAEL